MSKCKNCGATIEMADATFCPFCGKKIVVPTEHRITSLDYINACGVEAALEVMNEISGMDSETAANYLYKEREPIVVYQVIVQYDCADYQREHRVHVKRERLAKKHFDHFKRVGFRYHDRTGWDRYSNERSVIERTTLKKGTKPKDFGFSVFWTEDEAREAASAAGWGDVLK